MGLTPKQKAALDMAERLYQGRHQMTNPTDTELDALQISLRNGDQMNGKTVNCKHDQCNCYLLCDADDAITTLRAQLAEVRAERDDFADQIANLVPALNREAVEQRARADRAEAALAAQIERDADMVTPATSCYCRDCQIRRELAATLRAQPHDRSALDRMQAEARVKALREAADADWMTGKDIPDDAPKYLSDWQRGIVAGVQAKRAAILALAQEGGKG